MRARVKWIENVTFVAEAGSGHAIVLDGAPEHGGRNLGIRPMEAVLIGTGACSAFDVVSILRKSRQSISDCQVELSAERAEEPPRVFTSIHMHFVVTGAGLKESQVKRAVELSAEKYCSATAMLRPKVRVTHDYEVVDTGAPAGRA